MKTTVPILDERLWFPDPQQATRDGLVALGGDLSVERLLLAYSRGIFPWTVSPLSWWSPNPRGIFELNGFHISRSFAKVLRKRVFRVSSDQAFRQVIEECGRARPGRQTTWISPEFVEAYTRLHKRGNAHSVECWQDEQLVGGIYGVTVGGLFAGESMFHSADDASKIALYHLMEHLKERGFQLFDIQMVTPITNQLGAVTISRRDYLKRLAAAVKKKCQF